MKKMFYIIILFISQPIFAFADKAKTGIDLGEKNLIKNQSWELTDILSYGEQFLLKVVLPLVVIGTFLYIAYELLTAEGNEEKMKKAWKTVTFSSI